MRRAWWLRQPAECRAQLTLALDLFDLLLDTGLAAVLLRRFERRWWSWPPGGIADCLPAPSRVLVPCAIVGGISITGRYGR